MVKPSAKETQSDGDLTILMVSHLIGRDAG
jgi:hypothetical protein